MSRRFYNLPPLTTLSAFETAARHLSFKDAAQELSVTPGAVSHQIKALEGDLGVALFQRQHRGVTLTADGQALHDVLASSFGRIAKRLDTIRESDDAEKVTVGSTTAVAAFWLSPSIVQFWRAFPDTSVDQLTQDAPFSPRTKFDFYIRYGRDEDQNLPHTPLYRDELIPVATPELADRLKDAALSDLATHWLIHLKSDGRDWTTWHDWFRELNYDGPINKGTQVTSYLVALQLASKGTGLALGWRRLIKPLLDSGDLAIVGQHSLPAPREFYLVESNQDVLSANAISLRNWLLKSEPGASH